MFCPCLNGSLPLANLPKANFPPTTSTASIEAIGSSGNFCHLNFICCPCILSYHFDNLFSIVPVSCFCNTALVKYDVVARAATNIR